MYLKYTLPTVWPLIILQYITLYFLVVVVHVQKVSWIFKFFEDELDRWRRIAWISKAKEDKEIKYRERFERTCSK